MSKMTLFKSSMALNAANKVVEYLLLAGIEHLDLEIGEYQIILTAFVRDYKLLPEVQALMRLGNYSDYEYKEIEGKHDNDNFMMCELHYNLVKD